MIGRGRRRPRHLRYDDDGISVPWLSSAIGVYCIAMLNTGFWAGITALSPYSGLEAVVFNIVLFAALAAAYAFICNALLICGMGKPLVMALLFAASLGAYIQDSLGLPVTLDALREAWNGGLGGLMHVSAIWKLGLLGLVPTALLGWVRVGRRSFGREGVRRVRYGLCCLVLIGCAVLMQQHQFQLLREAESMLRSRLNPVNIISLIVDACR